jgi:hypothetical protein
VHCGGKPHIPFDGRSFVRDFVHELCRLADQHHCPPTYPEKSWWHALKIADERDRLRFATELNSRDDSSYFSRQSSFHICTNAAAILIRDGFSAAAIHRTAAGATRIVPEIHEFKTPEDGRHARWQNERGQVERARITARANGNGTRAAAP